MRGKTETLPLYPGTGKSPLKANYINRLPLNMLNVPPGKVNAAGYMRSFPGLVKISDVAGVSRGVLLNAYDGKVYRVCGGALYQGGVSLMAVAGTERVSMAGSNQSVAVAADGAMLLRKYDGTVSTLENWPATTYYPGETLTLTTGSRAQGYDGSIAVTQSMVDKGRLELTLIPRTTSGATGEALVVDKLQHTFDQSPPTSGTPYLTDVRVLGFSISGTELTLSYTFNANGADGDDDTVLTWRQIVEPTTIDNAQYDLGTVADITHANARYAWLKAGTNTFGVTDIDDEGKPDRYRPVMTATAMPDPAVGIASLAGDIWVFGTVSTEVFTLTGSSDTSDPIYRPQQAAMIPMGIAGVHCKALVGEQFAVISHPAGGQVSVFLMGNGRSTDIAAPFVRETLATLRPDELAQGVVEFINMPLHALIIVHVPGYVFCYDMNSKQWAQLSHGNNLAPHTAVDFALEGNHITVGDTAHAITGRLDDTSAAQYGELQSHLLYTPLMNIPGAVLADLELNTASGLAQHVEHLAVSATTDGETFPVERLLISDGPQQYRECVTLPVVGYVAKEIAFRYRILTKTPFTASTCTVRVT
ncbi:packaged DNA stabilization protein [Klebsiella aerogenes]|uniref:packaged DNA stabilization protein n=1 Tax=Klebsiella aerogenes TaxID=548 RepID=UPI00351D797F